MIGAEIVNRTHQIHSPSHTLALTGQCPPTTNQTHNPGAKCPVQSLNVGHIDLPSSLGMFQKALYLLCAPLDNPSHHFNHFSTCIPFDNLGYQNPIPRSQLRASRLPGLDRLPENGTNGANVGLVSIHAKEQRATQGCCPHLLHQVQNQAIISMGSEHSSQPQASACLYSHCHPEDSFLHFHPDFVHLHLAEVSGLLNQVLMYPLAMLSGSCLPTQHRFLIEAECHYDGLDRATVSQKSDYNGYNIPGCSKAIENGALCFGESFAAYVADISSFFAAMNTDVSFADLPSCGAIGIRAEHSFWVHRHTPDFEIVGTLIVPVNPILSSSTF